MAQAELLKRRLFKARLTRSTPLSKTVVKFDTRGANNFSIQSLGTEVNQRSTAQAQCRRRKKERLRKRRVSETSASEESHGQQSESRSVSEDLYGDNHLTNDARTSGDGSDQPAGDHDESRHDTSDLNGSDEAAAVQSEVRPPRRRSDWGTITLTSKEAFPAQYPSVESCQAAREMGVYGSTITLLPLRFQFGVLDQALSFAINSNVPPASAPHAPIINKSSIMIDVGIVRDNCPPLEYARTEVKRAGQVASAKVDVRPGYCGYTLITKSGYPLPSPAGSAVYFFRHYSKSHIECLVGQARMRYVQQAQGAQHQYDLEYHDWY